MTIGLVLVLLLLGVIVYVLNADELSQSDTNETTPLQILPTLYGEYDIIELDISGSGGSHSF